MPPTSAPEKALPPSTDMRVSAEKVRALQSNVPWMMNGYVLSAWFAAWLLYDDNRAWTIWLWVVGITVASGLNALAGMHAKKRVPRPQRAQQRLQVVTRASFVFGFLWALGVLILWPTQRIDLQVFLMFLTAGLASGALLSISVHLPAFYAYFLPCIASLLIGNLYEGQTVNYLIAAATAAYLVACMRFVKTLSETFVSLMRTRFEVAELAEHLKQQKEVAEEASLSKSRFLAAASHDLRQPVHSLALFLGTLTAQAQTAEGERVIGHMRTTLDALGSMFNALLNISKLDANMVQPEWTSVDLQQLLQNVCDAEALVAREKGLSLRLRCDPLWVQTDGILLDRVIRNLVNNAVRYTDRGGVLVSGRLRGHHIVVRVWDTGQGIPADQQEEVFHEFVQLHNAERDRNNGLGLGLAIVRRLTDLLQIELQLQSRPKRGSVFSLRMRPALLRPRESGVPLPANAEEESPAAASGHALIIVIDDDAMIRLGTSSLLKSWGYEVLTASGQQDLHNLVATAKQAPSLVICDLRLRHGENGIETVEYLRTQFNDDLPAILITGDTDPQRLQQAEQSGLMLLHKPVPPEQLQAAIRKAILSPGISAVLPAAPHAGPLPPPGPD